MSDRTGPLGITLLLGAAVALSAVASTASAQSTLEMSYHEEQNNTPPQSVPAEAQEPEAFAAEQLTLTAFPSERATYALSRKPWHDDHEILWPGFLSGMRGFEHFYEPVGNPLYFESPFINSSLRLLYLHHDCPNRSQLGGGDVNIYAAQIRLALTDRLAFIATKDGYSTLDARILPEAEGWNDFAIGLKYALLVVPEEDFVLTAGMRWEWSNGDIDILQGDSQELSPFLSFAKGWDRWHLLGNLTARIPTDQDRGNNILQWDLHLDYEIAPETLPGFAPLVELHGLHYLSDANHLPLALGGLDYTNFGSFDVSGESVVSAGIGFRWKLNPHTSIGSTWEFPLTDRDDDIMGNRLTFDVILSW
ncbi:MAG: hypothetical protein AB7N71_03730 [Phycisphaerae bacterium]